MILYTSILHNRSTSLHPFKYPFWPNKCNLFTSYKKAVAPEPTHSIHKPKYSGHIQYQKKQKIRIVGKGPKTINIADVHLFCGNPTWTFSPSLHLRFGTLQVINFIFCGKFWRDWIRSGIFFVHKRHWFGS